ncbi:MAG: biopolymer transporter ExbD [Acidobacteria bacterium]|jgi:biopolymer transport protein ExbD/biopolymer transport protein TolR|nr:biopolymer transporter ExbD [Acidobacteriota bacterium]
MGMSSGGGGGLNSEINVTPMVDIMLVLLIIFMLVTPQLQQGITVEIPKETSNADDDKAISSADSLVISIPTDGEFYLGKVKYSIDLKNKNDPGRKNLTDDLKKEIDKKKSDEERIVYIKSGVNVSYGQLVGIIDVVRNPDAGGVTQIGLVADRKKGAKPVGGPS